MPPHILRLLIFSLTAHALCYFPNGDAARGDLPCRSTKDFSACCGRGYKCVSNGMCQSSEDQLDDPRATEFVRGSCDDQQWKSANCPNYCIENNPSGGAGIVKCQGYTNRFYCTGMGANASRCDDDQEHLSFSGDPYILTTLGVETSTESTASTTESTVSATEESTTEASSTEAETTASTSSPAETAAASSGSSSGSDSKAAVIGGAVGGGVGGLLLGGLGVWLVIWLWKRKKAAAGTGETEESTVEGVSEATEIKSELPGESTVSPIPSPPSELPGHYPDNQTVR